MASAQLTIAKAGLLAALLKPDLVPCPRDEIEQLHGLLSAAAARCSPANVQKCKQWMLKHLVRSPARTVALAKYLVAFANSQQQQQLPGGDAQNGVRPKPSAKRKRLHLLYVLNDVFFHVKSRTREQIFLTEAEPHLPALFKSAAAFTNAPKHEKKLQDLIKIWQQENYFSDALLAELRAAVTDGPTSTDSELDGGRVAQKATTASSASTRDAPYILPSMHGDASAPWYDLPAANWLPVIEPNSTRPMNPSMIRPLQLASGPADKTLVDAVKKLLVDVDKIYAKDVRLDGDSAMVDISQMGEIIERDEIGDIVGGETYYGWTRAFCEKMKARRKNGDAMDIDDDRRGRRGSSRSDDRSRSRSRGGGRSSSRSSSRPVVKRRRLSNSRSRSRSRDRSRNRSRRDHNRRRSHSRRRSRSYSSRSRSRSPPRHQHLNGRDTRSSSRNSYSPPRAFSSSANMLNNGPPPPPPPAAFMPPNPQTQFNQPPPGLPNFPGVPNFPTSMGGVPPPPQGLPRPPSFDAWNGQPPPPPPQHYPGHWPPPPPPGMPPSSSGLPQPTARGWFPPNAGGSSALRAPAQTGWGGGWASPPGPTQQQGSYGHAGRGGGSGGYRGRGYGRGRGW